MEGRRVVWSLGVLLVLLVGVMGYIRLAPSDPARWHVDLAAGDLPKAHVFCIRPGTGHDGQADPRALLAELDGIALATPRTRRLAGSPEEGRITWVTRSALMGFPDYTTAQVMEGAGLCVAGRQRFGSEDLGVNAARIGGWMQSLLRLDETPEMTGF
jgi:uncharacterized protein (DUF1499 family)